MDRLRASVLSDDTSFLLARANAVALAAAHSALVPFDLRVRSYSILALVSTGTSPSQRELAEFLRLDPSQVVALIDDLERRGLIKRETDPRDRRLNVVVTTEAGDSVFREARVAVRAAETEFRKDLSPKESEQLKALLQILAFHL